MVELRRPDTQTEDLENKNDFSGHFSGFGNELGHAEGAKSSDKFFRSLCNWTEATWSGIFVDLLLAERWVKWLPVQNFKQI